MKTETLELWLCVAANGDYQTGTTEDEARERFVENIEPLEDTTGFRLVRLNLTVPLPVAIEASGTVPETDGEVALTVAA
jgi:hypothetical protein